MGRKGSGMGIAPTLSFCPTIAPFEKRREHILGYFFGTQSLLKTWRQSSLKNSGLQRNFNGGEISMLGLLTAHFSYTVHRKLEFC